VQWRIRTLQQQLQASLALELARLAEAGASAKEIMSVTGRKTLAEVQRYADAADNELLAERAIAKLKQRKA
jgi:hypothetical protein